MARPQLEVPGATAARGLTVHVVADSDTRWKWGTALALRLGDGGATLPGNADARAVALHGHLLDGRAAPSAAQLADVAAPQLSLTRGGVADAVAALSRPGPDVVVLACVGGTIHALLHGLGHAWRDVAARPVVVTGYVGLVYERVVDGLLLRAGADVVVANCPADLRTFRDVYAGVGVDPSCVVPSLLPFLAERPVPADGARPFTVAVAAQPGVPTTRAERQHLLEQAAEHARRHPDRRVVLKLRARPGERTTHREPYPYPDLRLHAPLPANVEFAYGPMADVLDRTDLCVTVSSTAALEAAARGIAVAVLTDYGVREALGNQVFVGSGALTSWPQLHAGHLPRVTAEWALEHGAAAARPDPWADLRDTVAGLLAGRTTLAPLSPWLTVERAGAYLPPLLARHGLAVDGAPLRAAGPEPRGDGRGRASRRLLRAGARRAYRLGVTRVEPRLRSWANT